MPESLRVIIFAETQAEKDEWMRMLSECVGKIGSMLMKKTNRERERYPISLLCLVLMFLQVQKKQIGGRFNEIGGNG